MKVRINNNKPNAAQRKALRAECEKEFDKLLIDFNRQTALQILYILRFSFGFGQERLRKFSDELAEMRSKMKKHYEIKDDDVPDICEIKLRESGINVDEFLVEVKSE